MLLAAHQGRSVVSEAGRANIPLEEGDSVSNTMKQNQLSSLVLSFFFTGYVLALPPINNIKDGGSKNFTKILLQNHEEC